MSWFGSTRKPEPEVMDDAGEVEAYASAAAQAWLDALDDTLVDQVISLGIEGGRVLDVGTGPGSIPLKIARRRPAWKLVGFDKSLAMLRTARQAVLHQGLDHHLTLGLGDAARMPFPDATFDLVLSNSVLHHLHEPVAVFNEMARVAKPGGIVLVRDLRRPSRLLFAAHAAWHGRHYAGRMKKLYRHSLRAAYTPVELAALLRGSALQEARIFFVRRTYLGFIGKGQPAKQELT